MTLNSIPTRTAGGENAPVAVAAFRLKKILAPTDFSEASVKALRYAGAFARQSGAKILLLHVVEPVYYPMYGTEIIPDLGAVQVELLTASRTHLEEFSRAKGVDGGPLELIVSEGVAWAEIIIAAKQQEADLIILSTHGHTGLRHALLGSTAERVVRHAGCPVLTVREQEREFIIQD